MIKIGIIVQARLKSTRLPEKIIKPFFGEQSVLDILLENINSAFSEITKILAVPDDESKSVLSRYAIKNNFVPFYGSESDVLERFVKAGKANELTHIIRVCSDNPFLRMDWIQELIDLISNNPSYDYISFKNLSHIPSIKTHIGLFAEGMRLSTLEVISKQVLAPLYKEHVTNYLYSQPDKFKVLLVDQPELIIAREDIRLTLDDPQDFINLQHLYAKFVQTDMSLSSLVLLIDQDLVILEKMKLNIKKYSK